MEYPACLSLSFELELREFWRDYNLFFPKVALLAVSFLTGLVLGVDLCVALRSVAE